MNWNHRYILSLAFGLLVGAKSANAEQGGISGGGGGTTNPNPARAEDISRAISRAKPMIKAWLQAHDENSYSPGSETAWKKLYQSSPNVLEMIDKAQLQRRLVNPCSAPQGQATDGSAFFNQGIPTICISEANLQKKLSEYNYEYETIALIMHELAHLVGADENEAVSLQRDIIAGLIPYSYEDYREHLRDPIFYLKWIYQRDLSYLNHVTYAPDCHRFSEALEHINDFSDKLRTERGHPTPLSRTDDAEIDRERLRLADFYTKNCNTPTDVIPLEKIKKFRPAVTEMSRTLEAIHDRMGNFLYQQFPFKFEM